MGRARWQGRVGPGPLNIVGNSYEFVKCTQINLNLDIYLLNYILYYKNNGK